MSATLETSRRSFLGISAATLAGAANLRSAVALPAPRIVFGINHNYFPQFTKDIPGACGVRIYIADYNLIPAKWPDRLPSARSLLGGPVIPPGTHTVLSIRPMQADLFSGRLDQQIRSLALSAPPGSALNAWHENEPGNPIGYPPEVNNAHTASRMHEYVNNLCRNTNAAYGSIICAPANQLMDWMGRGLDWYGLDNFAVSRYVTPAHKVDAAKWQARMHGNWLAWQQVSGTKWPRIKICETNSPRDSIRSPWFTMVAGWLAAHNGDTMLTYWNPHGRLSGPWPPSAGVRDTLRHLTRTYYLKRQPI